MVARAADPVTWHAAADAVVVVHLTYLLFVAVGGFLAWRWRWVIVPHVLAVGWALATVSVGEECPLTTLQRHYERLAGDALDRRGFVDRYLEGVVYPARFTGALRLLVGTLVVLSWAGLVVQARRRRAVQPSIDDRASTSAGA
jgi:hypothetical protein